MRRLFFWSGHNRDIRDVGCKDTSSERIFQIMYPFFCNLPVTYSKKQKNETSKAVVDCVDEHYLGSERFHFFYKFKTEILKLKFFKFSRFRAIAFFYIYW